jgi:hypothetical protein
MDLSCPKCGMEHSDPICPNEPQLLSESSAENSELTVKDSRVESKWGWIIACLVIGGVFLAFLFVTYMASKDLMPSGQ